MRSSTKTCSHWRFAGLLVKLSRSAELSLTNVHPTTLEWLVWWTRRRSPASCGASQLVRGPVPPGRRAAGRDSTSGGRSPKCGDVLSSPQRGRLVVSLVGVASDGFREADAGADKQA